MTRLAWQTGPAFFMIFPHIFIAAHGEPGAGRNPCPTFKHFQARINSDFQEN